VTKPSNDGIAGVCTSQDKLFTKRQPSPRPHRADAIADMQEGEIRRQDPRDEKKPQRDEDLFVVAARVEALHATGHGSKRPREARTRITEGRGA